MQYLERFSKFSRQPSRQRPVFPARTPGHGRFSSPSISGSRKSVISNTHGGILLGKTCRQ